MTPFGISEAAVGAILAQPEQSHVIAIEGIGTNQPLGMFAGRAKGDRSGHVILVIGLISGDQLQVVMAFKIPPQIADREGTLEPPLRMLEGLANLCGVPVVLAEHIAKFITSERIPVPAGTTIQGPFFVNPANSRLMTMQLVRPVIAAGQAYADCALCFAIEIEAYERVLGLRSPPPQPDPATHQIALIVDDAAKQTMMLSGVSAQRAIQTVRQRHSSMLILSDKPMLNSIRWFEDGDIVFVSALVTKSRPEGSGIWIDEVRAAIVLSLRPNLPGGVLDRNTEMAQLLPVIARSFGRKVLCHPAFGFSSLYTGPWDGQMPRYDWAAGDETLLFSGSFDNRSKTCSWVWAFSPDAYRRWRQSLRIS